jgi:hypothetical protein
VTKARRIEPKRMPEPEVGPADDAFAWRLTYFSPCPRTPIRQSPDKPLACPSRGPFAYPSLTSLASKGIKAHPDQKGKEIFLKIGWLPEALRPIWLCGGL